MSNTWPSSPTNSYDLHTGPSLLTGSYYLDTGPTPATGSHYLDTGPSPPGSRSLDTGPSPLIGSYYLDTGPSPPTCSYDLDRDWALTAPLPLPRHRALAADRLLPPRHRLSPRPPPATWTLPVGLGLHCRPPPCYMETGPSPPISSQRFNVGPSQLPAPATSTPGPRRRSAPTASTRGPHLCPPCYLKPGPRSRSAPTASTLGPRPRFLNTGPSLPTGSSYLDTGPSCYLDTGPGSFLPSSRPAPATWTLDPRHHLAPSASTRALTAAPFH